MSRLRDWRNRLWVRLSLMMIGAYLIIVVPFLILPSVASLILHVTGADEAMSGEMMEGSTDGMPMESTSTFVARRLREISTELYRVVIFGSVIGIIGGVWASWRLSKPITRLVDAADAVRRRDFDHRVEQNRWASELATLADTFNNMARELDESERLRRQLITDVAHELRTPLTVLAGNLNAALDHVYELTEEEFANLYMQTNHLIRLVNDLHELSQAEAKQLPLTQITVDMNTLIRETVSLYDVLAEEQGVSLVCEITNEPLLVDADEARMRQVLHNLIYNAIAHTPEGGTISILARHENHQVVLSVRDTGVGINPDHLPHIYDRFYRTDRARSRVTGGTGLGLAIVKAIVEAHGGSVSAQSGGLNQGALFTVLLPLKQSAKRSFCSFALLLLLTKLNP